MIQFVFVKSKKEIKADEYLLQCIEILREKIATDCEYDFFEEDNLLVCDFNDSDGSSCRLFMAIVTYSGVKQLTVKIDIQDPENFNELAYKLKELVKDNIIKDWDQCVWLEDSQSALYAQQLYPKIYKVENRLREFINIVMVKVAGITWWENHVSHKLNETYGSRHSHLRITAPLYRNIDAKLLSINTDQLTEIMKFKQKKWVPKFDESIEDLITNTDQKNVHALKGRLQGQLEIKIDSWKEIFSKYFDEDFLDEWETFCKNRNHVAHNKLIDKIANLSIRTNIEIVQNKIEKAFKDYYSVNLSDEDQARMHNLQWESVLEIIEMESNITIKDYDEIMEIINVQLDEIAVEVVDEFHFRNDLVIEHNNSNPIDIEQTLITISSKIFEDISIEIRTVVYINDSSGEQSTADIKLYVFDKVVNIYEVTYTNGKAYFNEEQGNFMPEVGNKLSPVNIELLINDLNELVDVHFPNKVEGLEAWDYSSIKDGGISAAAEFVCEECGEGTVSINNDFHEYGACVNCGHNQSESIKTCFCCETLFNWNLEGGDALCGSCEEFIKNE